MKVKWYLKHSLAICLAWLLFIASSSQASTRILFIGNSYTFFNGGIDQQLKGLASSIDTSQITAGGYTLERHWSDGGALRAIRQGPWSYVVLQEQSQIPVFSPQKFYQFAGEFDREIKGSGAQTILLMTWERPDSIRDGATTENLAKAYKATGANLRAKVAPVGLAFARSLKEKPDLLLCSHDGHPTVYGTYLAACVLYGTIFGQSPVGNLYSNTRISPEIRAYLQSVAAKSLGY